MKLRLIECSNGQKQLLEVSTVQGKIAVCFGEELGTGEIIEDVNPMIEGLTNGTPDYDGIFILRNPENCNIANYVLPEIPIYLEQKINKNYNICKDFMKLKHKNSTKGIESSIKIKDLQIMYFLIDNSNANTSMLLIIAENKSVLISGDFKNFDVLYGKEKLIRCLEIIKKIDYWFMDGSFIGKFEPGIPSESEFSEKLRNIVKLYKQVFIIQSETDLAIAKRFYDIAIKTKKIFIEDIFLANLASETNGSAPNPITSKKVFTYTALGLDNKDFEFKQKYISHFYISNATDKMKKEKFIMNINLDMFQDLQIFKKKNIMYDACMIFAMNKKVLKINKRMEEFISLISEFGMDYYELYTSGKVDCELINRIASQLDPKKIIPLNFNPNDNTADKIYKFEVLSENDIVEI